MRQSPGVIESGRSRGRRLEREFCGLYVEHSGRGIAFKEPNVCTGACQLMNDFQLLAVFGKEARGLAPPGRDDAAGGRILLVSLRSNSSDKEFRDLSLSSRICDRCCSRRVGRGGWSATKSVN